MSSRRGRVVTRGCLVALGPACALGTALLGTPARAEPRPTEGGGPWTFDASDELADWDEPTGAVRVHYSVAGPNATRQDDEDGDLVPDFPQLVGSTTAAALGGFVDELGLRAPVSEAEVGLELGGSPALDVYLVDFAGASDGRFGVDACIEGSQRCAGVVADESARARVCVGGLEHVEGCMGSGDEAGEGSTDGGATDAGSTGDETGDEATAGAGDATGGVDEGSGEDAGQAADGEQGCGCRASAAPGVAGVLPWLLLPALRRRESRPA